MKCKCFNVCSIDGLSHFLRSIPENITTRSSPWMPYLDHVYLSRTVLPYMLSSMRMWYLQTGLIPMASCSTVSSTAIYSWPNAYHQQLREHPTLPWCDQKECSAWYKQYQNSEAWPPFGTQKPPNINGTYHIYPNLGVEPTRRVAYHYPTLVSGERG